MIDLRGVIYNILNDNTIPAGIAISKVEPNKSGNNVSVGNVSRVLTRIGQTTFEVKSHVCVYVSVEKPMGYAQELDTIVDQITTKLLTSQSFLKDYDCESVRTAYKYSEAGETNLAEAEITFAVDYTDVITPTYNVPINLIHFNLDKDANNSIEHSWEVQLNTPP